MGNEKEIAELRARIESLEKRLPMPQSNCRHMWESVQETTPDGYQVDGMRTYTRCMKCGYFPGKDLLPN